MVIIINKIIKKKHTAWGAVCRAMQLNKQCMKY